MKYVLLFCDTADGQAAWDKMPADAREKAYEAVYQWFGEHESKLTGGYEFQPPSTATTVRFDGNHQPIVTDGPFIEGNEVIGGYADLEAADLDEALRIAKSWPGGGVEIRPVVER
jgi:hypothetical protein